MSRHRAVLSDRRVRSTLAVLAAASVFGTAHATTIAVTGVADDFDLGPNGNCTLREAVIAANTDHAIDACPAGSGADTITIPAGTYFLAIGGRDENQAWSGDLDITDSVTLAGAGADVTILDAAFQDRVIEIHRPARDLTVTIRDLTVRAGRADDAGDSQSGFPADSGGGINTLELTFLEDCVVEGNRAVWYGGGLSFGGSFQGSTVSRCEVRDNISGYRGGGVFGSVVTIEDSVVSGNVAVEGGGVLGSEVVRRSIIDGNQASQLGGGAVFADLEDTLVTDNHSDLDGGGVAGAHHVERSTIVGNVAERDGGGLFVSQTFPSASEITTSTVSGNSAERGGGIFVAQSSARLTYTTVTGNTATGEGGGVAAPGAQTGLEPRGSIIAGNGAPVSPDYLGFASSFGANLVGDGSGATGFLPPADQVGTSASPIDPLVGPLAMNGGLTPTHALLTGSPAIDRAESTCPTPDQRGVVRPQGPRCDVGSVEAQTAGCGARVAAGDGAGGSGSETLGVLSLLFALVRRSPRGRCRRG